MQGGMPVGGALGSIDELICKALCNGLDVAEGGFASASGEQVDGGVDPPQRGDIHSLPPDDSSRADPGGIFSWAAAAAMA